MQDNNEFLPSGYEVPAKAGNYMKFEQGENRFRVLSSPIIGNIGWNTESDGSRKPIRKRMGESFSIDEIDDPSELKHFWAMPVFNYQTESIQILEITQKGIQKSIKALVSDSDWGSPVNYDLVVKKTGEKMETRYSVMPKPAKKLDPGIKEAFEDMNINLNALYEGKDPFAQDDQVDVDSIPDLGQAQTVNA